MEQPIDLSDPKTIASEIDARIRALPVRNVPNVRVIRREYSRLLKKVLSPEFVLQVARELVHTYGHRGVSYELLLHHKAAFQSLGEVEIEELGRGISG